MSRSILVIADEHEHDIFCLEKAHNLASPLNAKLEVVRFLSNLDLQDEPACKKIVAKATQSLDHDISDIFADDTKDPCKKSILPADKIADWVVDYCKKKPFDLVVKTGHRTEKLFHIPIDWQLMRNLSCPLLIASNNKWKSKKVVMAAVDLSTQEAKHKELNESVLQWASIFSDAFDCSVHVVYSIPISRILVELDIVEKNEYQKRKQNAAESQLQTLLDNFELNHVTAGLPEKTIPHIANELKADLVIIGCVGRKGLKGSLVGNTAEKVLHHLRTDTLIVENSGVKIESMPLFQGEGTI